MNVAQALLVSASKAQKEKQYYKSFDSLELLSNHLIGMDLTPLKLELEEAEKLYAHLKRKRKGVSRIKLKNLGERITILKQIIETRHQDDIFSFDGTSIQTPLFQELYDELDALDEYANISDEDLINPVHVKEVTRLFFSVLGIPPPPPLDEIRSTNL